MTALVAPLGGETMAQPARRFWTREPASGEKLTRNPEATSLVRRLLPLDPEDRPARGRRIGTV